MLNIGDSGNGDTSSISDAISMKSFDSQLNTQISSQSSHGGNNDLSKQHELLFVIFTLNNDGIFEFFSKSLWLFQRLWIEMKAQSLDFDRVF
jgi:hypothetical protein